MVWVEGGWLQMGSDRIEALPEERPSHAVKVSGFWIDRTEVTNAQFAAFVEATGYRTTAELPVPAEVFTSQLEPGAPAQRRRPAARLDRIRVPDPRGSGSLGVGPRR
ncbi:MAG: SUMF1/EgtB/PvdO family nonheme iron enzyme [Planctomycetota bacterium]